MSHTSVSGLVGVSAISSLVLGRMAACHSVTSVWLTKLDSTPNLANSVPINLIVLPNTEREHSTWSPAFKRPMHSSKIALMPLLVPMQTSVHSSAARRFSMAVTVGLVNRL